MSNFRHLYNSDVDAIPAEPIDISAAETLPANIEEQRGRPGDNRPGNGRPGDGRPGDGRPGNNRPGNNRPGDHRPDNNRPGDHRPGGHRPDNDRRPPVIVIPPHSPFPQNPSTSYIQFLINQCMGNMMYVTIKNGDEFWYYPQDFFQDSVNGYRWNAQAGWFPYSIQLNTIKDLYCYNP